MYVNIRYHLKLSDRTEKTPKILRFIEGIVH